MKGMLSVIIPVCNTEKYIQKCLNSIIHQTYKNLEIIIVDDGSEDASLSICKEIEKKESRVFVYSNNNKGVSSARNLGIKKAKGEYITFVDSDDYLETDAYEKALNNIGENDAVFFGYSEIYEYPYRKIPIIPMQTGTVNNYEAILNCMVPDGKNYFTSVCNKIFKKNKIDKVLFDNSFSIGEDEVWLIQSILKLTKITLYNEPLYNYIQRPNSAIHSNEQIIKNWMSQVEAKEKVIELVAENKKCCECIMAKEYKDLFYLAVKSYCVNGYLESKKILDRTDWLKDSFFISKYYSYKKKIRFKFIYGLIRLRAPKSIIMKTWETTTQKIIQTFLMKKM